MSGIRIGNAAAVAAFILVVITTSHLSGKEASVPIRTLRSADAADQIFTVEGVVIDDRQRSDPNASERIYIQDSTGGLRVVAGKPGILMGYTIGDRIRVRGRFVSSNGRAKLAADFVEPLDAGLLPLPKLILAADASSPENLGRLVRVSGQIRLPADFETRSRGLSVADRSGQIAVPVSNRYLRNREFSTHLIPGAAVSVVGIPEQSNADGSGIYLRVRELADFQFQPAPPYLELGAAVAGLAVCAAFGFLISRRRQAEGHAIELRGVLNDLKKSQEALTESETRFRTLVENTADIMWEADCNLTYTYCSANAEAILEYSCAELTNRTLLDIEAPGISSGTSENINKITQGEAFTPFERTILTKSGRRLAIESSGLVLRDSEGRITGYRGVDRDVTARKELESDVRQAQKMEAVGQLAGGIAHDFNNTLTVISACTSLLEESQDAEVREYGEAINKAVARSAGMTRQLLAFSRKQVIQPTPLVMNGLLRDLTGMLRRVISEDIEIVENLADDLWHITADAGQIEQMVTNLVLNARDAMTAGGRILLQTQNVTIDVDDRSAEPLTIPPGDYVQFLATDTGHGMDAATQARIFEPFFTTKPEGKGTGLGLASVYGIVKQNGGFISIDSQVGEGTTFEILLPRTRAKTITGEFPSHAKQATAGSVLIVEDEEAVRRLTAEVLANHGYHVLPAAGREEALRICREFEGRIDILLSDVVLCKESGPSIASEIGVMRPDTKVLYMSGYTDDAIESRGMLEAEVNLIHKPFTASALAEALEAVLHDQPVHRQPSIV
jgi:PAS domain S-box-containing protein